MPPPCQFLDPPLVSTIKTPSYDTAIIPEVIDTIIETETLKLIELPRVIFLDLCTHCYIAYLLIICDRICEKGSSTHTSNSINLENHNLVLKKGTNLKFLH